MKQSSTPQFHTIVKQRVNLESELIIPVVYINTDNGVEIAESLVNYFVEHANTSYQWKQIRARACGMFYDYSLAYENFRTPDSAYCLQKLTKYFCWALVHGTIDKNTATDPFKLYWPPLSYEHAKRLSSAIVEFSNFCRKVSLRSTTLCRDSRFTPHFLTLTPSDFSSHLNRANTYLHRSLRKNKTREKTKKTDHKKITDTLTNANNVFPQELVEPLFTYGFIKTRHLPTTIHDIDITAQMLTVLIFFAGIREYEAFHLWTNDIAILSPLNDSCSVELRHPSNASTFIPKNSMSRETYLINNSLLPRHQHSIKSMNARWKSLKYDKALTASAFFIHDTANTLTTKMYRYYINSYRSVLTDIADKHGASSHPFLLVSNGIDYSTGQSYQGLPYSRSAYLKSFQQALDKVELALSIKIPRGKRYGTTPAGARNLYFKLLQDAGISQQHIDNASVHRTIMSYATAQRSSTMGLERQLNEARAKISSSPQFEFLNSLTSFYQEKLK